MTLAELREARNKIHAESMTIVKAAGENEDQMTDEQFARMKEISAEIDGLDEKITASEERAEALASAGARDEALKAAPKRKTTAETPGATVTDVHSRVEDDPRKGFKTPRAFMMSVITHCSHLTPLAELPENMRILKAAAGSDEHGTYSDPYGGFMLPVAFSPEPMKLDPEDDPMAGRTTNIPLASPKVELIARVDKDHSTSVSGGLTVGRSAETVAKTASRGEYEKIKMYAYSLFGLSYVTEELLTDSPVSFAAILAAGFSDEFTSHIIDERINGTGAGQYMGVLNSPCLVDITKETAQAADTINFENLKKMRARCWRYKDAVWLYNHDCLPQLMSIVMEIGAAGVAMWQSSAREDRPDMLFGRPAIATEYCKTIGDKGDIILGNWSQYLEGTYQPLQSAESIHVRFVNHERAFKFWVRNAGAPWWRSALTPKNSTATLSPFVVLKARA